MPMMGKPTPCSESRLPGWACRLAARATQGRLTTLEAVMMQRGRDAAGTEGEENLTPSQRIQRLESRLNETTRRLDILIGQIDSMSKSDRKGNLYAAAKGRVRWSLTWSDGTPPLSAPMPIYRCASDSSPPTNPESARAAPA